MKKILGILIFALLLTGCQNKITTVTNANGESKTYQFFTKEKYNPQKYNLKLKKENDNITIIRAVNKSYYKLFSKDMIVTIIEKNQKKYTIDENNKSISEAEINTYTNYSLGYLPTNMKTLKTQNYKTGKEHIGLFTYVFEEYTYQGGITTYYFKGKKLKKIKNKTTLNEEIINFVSISSKFDKKIFEVPKEYQIITY